ncbi:MAG: lysophospholipid acyltransferase family protein [Vicinamibacterales bacterium]
MPAVVRRELRGDPASIGRWHAGALNNGVVFGATCSGVSRLPRWCSYGIGHVGTWIAYRLMRRGTHAVIENLRSVRPDASDDELRRLALKTYRTYARDTIDFLRSLDMSRAQFQTLVAADNAGALDAVLALGRGVILVGGHFGNWELGGLALRTFKGCAVTVVGRPEPSPAVGRLRRRMRERFGIESVDIGHLFETALQLRRALAANTVVAMLIDRHFGRDRHDVVFFDRQTPFLRSPALMAGMSGAPLLPASMIRQPDGRFVGWFGTPVFVDSAVGGDDALRRATQAVATQLEEQIRAYPHLWYQFYPYWQDERPASARLDLAAARQQG